MSNSSRPPPQHRSPHRQRRPGCRHGGQHQPLFAPRYRRCRSAPPAPLEAQLHFPSPLCAICRTQPPPLPAPYRPGRPALRPRPPGFLTPSLSPATWHPGKNRASPTAATFGKKSSASCPNRAWPPNRAPARSTTSPPTAATKWSSTSTKTSSPTAFCWCPNASNKTSVAPLVVCQHGLEGRPQNVADPAVDNPSYHRYACRLAERGFVAYAPQNPYIGQDDFRVLQRLANPLKLSLFSFIITQHQHTFQWLAAQPFVDPARMAFYGLSYGGKTAVRVPPYWRSIACRSARPTTTNGSGKIPRPPTPTHTSSPARTRCSNLTWTTPSTTPR